MTFKELYQQTKELPTPSQDFISKIADATCREVSTVRQWLSGTQVPNQKAKARIAKLLGKEVNELFPPNESTTIENAQ